MKNKKNAYENKFSELAMKKHIENSNRGHEPILTNEPTLPIHDEATLKKFIRSLVGRRIA